MKKQSTAHIEVAISRILQIGVTVSVATILVGLVLLFVRQDHSFGQTSYHTFVATGYVFPHSVSALKNSVQAGEALGILELGVLLLILTPIIRVATAFLLFARKHDRPMAIVTVCVLVVLVSSFYLGVVRV